MPKDDAVFAADVESAFAALFEGLEDAGGVTDLAEAAQLVQYMVTDSALFTGLGSISGGTQPMLSRMKLAVLPPVRDLNPEHGRGPIDTMIGKLERWDGPEGTPSYAFKNDYLPDLHGSLGITYEILQISSAAMTLVEAIVDQSRQKYLDLLDNTLARIGEVARARQRSSGIASLVTAVFASVVGALTGGIATAIVGGLAAVGAAIDQVSTDPGEGELPAIFQGALDRAAGIRTAVEEEANNVAAMLDGALNYVVGPRQEQFLAPEIGSAG